MTTTMPKKKKKKANPTLEQVLKLVMKAIRNGCKSIDRTRKLDIAADRLFARRYSLIFRERLAEEGSWARDKDKVLLAARMHGVIAAAAARLSEAGTIPMTTFVKAAHMMELECEAYVRAGQEVRRQHNKPLFGGPWCW